MQLRHAYPVGTAGGCCFVTKRYEVDEQGIIDLDIDLDGLPGWGRLCVSPLAVHAMNQVLGWKIDTGESTSAKQLKATIAGLEADNEMLRAALRDIMRVLVTAGTVDELVQQVEAIGTP